MISQLKGKIRYIFNPEISSPNPWRFNSGLSEITPTHSQLWTALYDAATMHLDRELARFIEKIRAGKHWEKTVVVVTADHGEMLGEHQGILGHTLTLHDNILKVPLIVRHPDYPQGIQVEGVVQTIDLFPSILEWAEVKDKFIPSFQRIRPSLSNAVTEPGRKGGYAYAEEDFTGSYDVLAGLERVNPNMNLNKYPRKQIAVHGGAHKYIWYDDRPPVFPEKI